MTDRLFIAIFCFSCMALMTWFYHTTLKMVIGNDGAKEVMTQMVSR